ncbi:guanosine-5'-triphosphate,3'-diphosphate pyrophosphatase [mine drainage metagenome]|uniref:Guanosine-5'-triphosphate,3'-diphosphate pyrophosphatase n=1 Tax=mine drainage metagenome TaxID=410659 RepID=A0A1J5P6I1_9ZZZZ
MLLLVLRLAIILCHARQDPDASGLVLTCRPQRQRFALTVDEFWTVNYPQSAHLLRQECAAWQKTAWSFELLTRTC